MSRSMMFTGANGAAVRAWANEDAPRGSSWFLTKAMSAPTGGQAWRFVKDGQAWPDDVGAAVYDPGAGEWAPVRRGDTIVRFDGTPPRFRVLRPVDAS